MHILFKRFFQVPADFTVSEPQVFSQNRANYMELHSLFRRKLFIRERGDLPQLSRGAPEQQERSLHLLDLPDVRLPEVDLLQDEARFVFRSFEMACNQQEKGVEVDSPQTLLPEVPQHDP